jgi:hypothetical protein
MFNYCFKKKLDIPSLARREILEKLNIGIDEETTDVADLIMLTKGPVFGVLNGEVDRLFFGFSYW